jgi:F-type H+-transporting ATPase subunit delta
VREPTIARNYAEALLQLGEQSGQVERYAHLVEVMAGAIEADEQIRVVLESPRVSKAQKQELLTSALEGHAPQEFIRFLAAVVKRGRQGMIGAIAREYLDLVDIRFNRVHATVTVAREPDPSLQAEIKERLTSVLDKEVIPHFRHEPAILGGVIIRVGDRVMDGSLRRKMLRLRKSMMGS